MGVDMTDKFELPNRYDRQVRLWGEQGQRSIGQTTVAVIGSSALATEILKSLILAGIHSFKIFDDAVVNESDTGNNFFVTQADIRKYRGEVVTNYLNELNPSVKGSFACRSFNTSSSLSVFNDFSLVVGVRVSMDVAEYIADYLYSRNTPFVWTTSIGMIGYFRLSFTEHEVLNDHKELPPHDFRLHRPFESFKKFVDGFDLASMKHEQHSHVPYVVLLYKALEAWREQIGDPNALPQNYQQRKDFTGILMNMQILNEHGIYNEDNFAEAKQQIIKSFSGAKLGENVQRLFADTRSDGNLLTIGEASVFWIHVCAIKYFYEKHQYLPLSGSLPDMTSDTNTYTTMVKLFREQANAEAEEVYKYVTELVNSDKFGAFDISFGDTVNYCKNFLRFESITGTNLADEFKKGIHDVFSEIAKELKASLAQNCNSQGLLQDNGDMSLNPTEVSPLVWLVVLRASEYFYKGKNRYPGTNGVPCKIDAGDLFDRVKMLANETGDYELINNVDKLVPDYVVEEFCRYGNAELNVITSILGGVISQEIIKLCTQQYIPVDNTFIFDGNSQKSTSIRL